MAVEITAGELHDLFMSIDFRDDELGNAPVVVQRIVTRHIDPAIAVLAEMERHGGPDVSLFYAAKLRQALGIGSEQVECVCGSCKAAAR